jgi:hypothetical protein
MAAVWIAGRVALMRGGYVAAGPELAITVQAICKQRLFRHAPDVLVLPRDSPQGGCVAEVRGLVTKERDLGKFAFLSVVDANGTIQGHRENRAWIRRTDGNPVRSCRLD